MDNIPSRKTLFRLCQFTLAFGFLLLTHLAACTQYPLLSLPQKSVAVLADQKPQQGEPKVDILFVIDNSGTMTEEQAKLRNNFKSFIEDLVDSSVSDFQIGIITPDMDNENQKGKLIAKGQNAKILSLKNLTSDSMIKAFTENADVGSNGAPYEKHFEAIQAALSPQMLGPGGANEGFLRRGSLLAIIIVSDEDDCSHDGELDENKFSETCFTPPGINFRDLDGKVQNEEGQMDHLVPVDTFANFLKNLKTQGLVSKVLVSGIIGPPYITKPNSKERIDQSFKCDPDKPIECSVNPQGGQFNAYCSYLNINKETQCGGCRVDDGKGNDSKAGPGFRLYSLIEKVNTNDPKEQWFPICGDDESFKNALKKFAGTIIEELNFIELSKLPPDPTKLVVRIKQPDGSTTDIPAAAADGI
ncbi:MAG: vWA domain-containing protein, partial [Myxococcota bacterium]